MWLFVVLACTAPSGPADPADPTSAPPDSGSGDTGTQTSPSTSTTSSSTSWHGTYTQPNGRVWLVRWPPPAPALPEAAYATLYGTDEAEAGAFVDTVRDLDGDGADELLVVAPEEQVGPTRGGRSRVVFGIPGRVGEAQLDDAGVVISGTSGAWMHAVAAPGDLDGDGVDDLVLGTERGVGDAAYLLPGVTLTPGSLLGAAATGVHERDHQGMGRTVAPVGDIDGDGLLDLLIGDSGYGYVPGQTAGRAVLWRGSDWVAGDVVAVPAQATQVVGEPSSRPVGERLIGSPLGDVTGDGVPEVVVAQHRYDASGGFENGLVSIFDGATFADRGVLGLEEAPRSIRGSRDCQEVGRHLYGLGDLDGDGLGELSVSDVYDVYVFAGADLALPQQWEVYGAVVTIADAEWLEPAPDLDGDGVDDLVLVRDRSIEAWSGADWPAQVVLGSVDLGAVPAISALTFLSDGAGGWILALGVGSDALGVAL